MSVHMYIRIDVHRMTSKVVEIVLKLKVDEFSCNIRRSTTKIDDFDFSKNVPQKVPWGPFGPQARLRAC